MTDNCIRLGLVRRHGVPGEIYNLGGGTDLTNEALTGLILAAMGADWDRVTRVPDRMGQAAPISEATRGCCRRLDGSR